MRDYWDNLKLFNRNVRFFLLGTAVSGQRLLNKGEGYV